MSDSERGRYNQHDTRSAAQPVRHDGQRVRPLEAAIEQQRNAERYDRGERRGFRHRDEAAVNAGHDHEWHEHRWQRR